MAVTIYDVAEKAGVSTATVSKVLSNQAHVADSTRAKVRAVVKELNYRPSLAARGLTKARTYIIGLAFPYGSDYLFGDPHLMMFLRGVENIAAERNYNILLTPARELEPAAGGLQRLIQTRYVDGAITVGFRAALEAGVELANTSFPIVSLGYSSPHGTWNTVHADNRRGALQATRHLLRMERQRIGIINATATLSDLDERMAGHIQALREANIAFNSEYVAEGDFTEQSGTEATAHLMSQDPQPDAIFAFNDRMAIGAIQHLKREGKLVPEDVSVIGFDDIPAAAMYEPTLTTVRQPALEMGKSACRMLLGLIEGKIDYFPEAILPALLVIRQSCGYTAD